MINLDQDGDQSISLNEFATQYIEIIKKLRYRQFQMEEKMIESYEQYKHCVKLYKNEEL